MARLLVDEPAIGTESRVRSPAGLVWACTGPKVLSAASVVRSRASAACTCGEAAGPSITISAGLTRPAENWLASTSNACLDWKLSAAC